MDFHIELKESNSWAIAPFWGVGQEHRYNKIIWSQMKKNNLWDSISAPTTEMPSAEIQTNYPPSHPALGESEVR